MAYLTVPEIATLFFRNDSTWVDNSIGTVSTYKIDSLMTAYFITAKQFNWLKKAALMERKQTCMISNKDRYTIIDGSFDKNNITYFFTASEIKGGAAKFKLVYFPKKTVAESIDMANIVSVFVIAKLDMEGKL